MTTTLPEAMSQPWPMGDWLPVEPLPPEIETAVRLLAAHRTADLQIHMSKQLAGQGLRKFLEQTLIPLNEAVHERVVRGEMQTFQ